MKKNSDPSHKTTSESSDSESDDHEVDSRYRPNSKGEGACPVHLGKGFQTDLDSKLVLLVAMQTEIDLARQYLVELGQDRTFG